MLRGLGKYIRQHHLALIALFVAFSGSAYAASKIGPSDIKKNAVRSRHIKNGQVKRPDLAANAINANSKRVIYTFGPLPKEGTFRSKGGKLLILASGSAFRNSNDPGLMNVQVKLDGDPVTALVVYTNELDSHKAFPTGFGTTRVSAGEHTIRLEALSTVCGTVQESPSEYCTETDGNDFFQVSVIELP